MSNLSRSISRKSFILGGAAALAGAAVTGASGSFLGCSTINNTLSGINPKNFESAGIASIDSQFSDINSSDVPTKLYTITNSKGAELCITNSGARIVSLMMPNRINKMSNVVLGFNKIQDYLDIYTNGKNYYGAIVGRYANRIAKGKFSIDGNNYQVSTNEKGNMLHGGEIGFNYRTFSEVSFKKDSLCLKYESLDNENGFPGALTLYVTYTLNDDNTFGIYYEATTSKDTVFNISNHAYFILSGEVTHPITKDNLFIVSNKTTQIDSELIPTGIILDSQPDGPFDFFGTNGAYYKSGGRGVYSKIDYSNDQIIYAKGYDHNFVIMSVEEAAINGFDSAREFQIINNGTHKIKDEVKLVASAYSTLTGIRMDVVSSEPGLQIYDCNGNDGSEIGINGPFYKNCALAMETQHFPDSPNHSNFPNTILRAGETFRSQTEYRFSVQE